MYVSHVNLSSCKLTSQSVSIPFLLLCLVDPNKRRKCVCTQVCLTHPAHPRHSFLSSPVCVCVCVYTGVSHSPRSPQTLLPLLTCVCVCVCVCVQLCLTHPAHPRHSCLSSPVCVCVCVCADAEALRTPRPQV